MDAHVQERIRKILALLEGAKTEGEAQAASLALQRLLKKEGLTIEDARAAERRPGRVVNELAESSPRLAGWKKDLAVVVANNYCCKTYVSTLFGASAVMFLGHEDDVAAAAACYRATARAAQNCYRAWRAEARRRAAAPPQPSLFGDEPQDGPSWEEIDRGGTVNANTYYAGFVEGLRLAYGEQVLADDCLVLTVRTPRDVLDAYNGMGLRSCRPSRRREGSRAVRDAGFAAGHGVGRGDRISRTS